MSLCLTFCGSAAIDSSDATLVSIAISPSPGVVFLI